MQRSHGEFPEAPGAAAAEWAAGYGQVIARGGIRLTSNTKGFSHASRGMAWGLGEGAAKPFNAAATINNNPDFIAIETDPRLILLFKYPRFIFMNKSFRPIFRMNCF